ncbi:cupin domain-containing protein [Nocardia sp. CDC159]|uniref:Cupin domain-containing protein n=1 Tax=Nocardia pulmonis TaxID=2951408 RepID=A0A9X2IY11_9NOCA|nr:MULTISPECIES: cupin domain-containing protein [Nocardia]MCM6774460.1 cupin domain-containing protein [Nocardia pulmonis]MCM6787474.1 cupin domain-containing protein [Nocardia sp. CDC159]
MTTATNRVPPTSEWPPSPTFWAESFFSATSSATAPALFSRLVPANVLGTAEVVGGLRRLRRAHAEGEAASARIRVYVGEERRDEVVETVLTMPWPDSEDVLEWMQRVCKAERFSLVVNNLETTSAALMSSLGTLIQSAFSGWGIPIGGCEQVAFVGNYAGTAFGIHEGFEDAFLVHLGPGTKHFYCWSQERYRELTGGTEPLFGDYRWMLEHGECFDLTPGDVLFLPRRVFHVGVQDEFSMSVAVPLYTYPDTRLLARSILPRLLEAVAAGDDSVPSPMHNLAEGPEPVAQALAKTAETLMSSALAQLHDHVGAVVEQQWAELLSNGGWEIAEHDLTRADAARSAREALAAGGTRLAVVAPFRLSWTQADSDLDIVLRGSRLRVPASPVLVEVITALADGKPIEIPDAARDLPALQDLLQTGGVEILVDEPR